MNKEYKIAIIGSHDAVMGFTAIGIDAIAISNPEQATEELLKLYNGDEYATVFITEDWVDKIKTTIDELPAKALPAIVAVPSQAGSTGAGLRNLKTIVEKAVGSDILS